MNLRVAIQIIEGGLALKSGRELCVLNLRHGARCSANGGRSCDCGQGVKIRSGGRIISINPDGIVREAESSPIIEAEVVGFPGDEIKRI